MSEQPDASCGGGPRAPEAADLASEDGGNGVATRLRRLVAAHLELDPRRLVPEARLGQDLCLDSLAAIELTMVIEDEFDISLPEEVVADVRTYGDVLGLVAERAGEHAS